MAGCIVYISPLPWDLSCPGTPHPWAPTAVRGFQALRCVSHWQMLIALSRLPASKYWATSSHYLNLRELRSGLPQPEDSG